MRSGPHLLARLHRKLGLLAMLSRAKQLDDLCSQIEAEIGGLNSQLAELRNERNDLRRRLAGSGSMHPQPCQAKDGL